MAQLELPSLIWQSLLQNPERKLTIQQEGYLIEIRIVERLVEEEVASSEKVATAKSKDSMYATNPKIPEITDVQSVIDPSLFVDDFEDKKTTTQTPSPLVDSASSRAGMIPPPPPPLKNRSKNNSSMRLELLDENPASTPLPVISGQLVEEETAASPTPSPSPMNINSTPSYRLLRTTDTPIVLRWLFDRLGVPCEQSIHLQQLSSNYPQSPLELAKEAGIKQMLSIPIPISESPSDPPSYRLIGEFQNSQFALLYQDDNGKLCFAPIFEDGGTLQIALQEGEELLTREELTALFQQGARYTTPEQARKSALDLQHKLANSQAAPPSQNPTFRPAMLQQNFTKTIPVDERLLKRLHFNRTHDDQNLWDTDLQPGVAIFRNNLATLYENGKPIIEGILICLISQNRFMIFDRRNKRSASLDPNANQELWLRHVEQP